MTRRRARNQGGTAAVEFALVAPFVLLLLVGTVTSALAYSDHVSITSAVREGARFGSAVDYNVPASDWAASVQTRVQQVYANAASNLATDNICVRLVTSTGTSVAAALGTQCGDEPGSPTNMAVGSCVVKVWVRKPQSISLVITSPLDFDIGAQSVSYYGRSSGSCTAG